MIVPLPADVSGPNNPWKTSSLAILPTMSVPEDVTGHGRLVYNAFWSLLAAIARWNDIPDSASEAPDVAKSRIQTVLVPGLGTGTGGIPATRCAEQMLIAAKHFLLKVPPNPRWDSVRDRMEEVISAKT
jgi:hypothetical protein